MLLSLGSLDDFERLVAPDLDSLRRLKADYRDKAPAAVETPENIRRRFAHHRSAADDPRRAEVEFERIINGNDLTSINYLEKGTIAARAVGRVHVRDENQDLLGFGTGFLISPRLMMTNNHVFGDAPTAGRGAIEFDFELDVQGRERPSVFFGLRPDVFFFTSRALDCAVVAVAETSASGARHVTDFGFLRLIADPGKAVRAEYLTIIQHPGGQHKQICVRENQLLKVSDDTLWYATDTLGGSSGSPVFNNSWQVVALHHMGVPERDAQGNILTIDGRVWDESMDESLIKWIANEGIRISRIVETLRSQHANDPLVREAVEVAALPAREARLAPGKPRPPGPPLTFTVPVTITLSIGEAGAVSAAAPALIPAEEKISIDPDYSTRKGFNPRFLGLGDLETPLPVLSTDQQVTAARLLEPDEDGNDFVLHYHHYSVIMNAARRLAFLTAVNIDGKLAKKVERERDFWIFDPRIDEDAQAGDELYDNNSLDRGHLVRRLDPAWGTSLKLAKTANDDTFHFTNCSPQHKDFNQKQTLWAGLEDYILNNARNRKFRASVFSGPVFANDDPRFRGILLPRQFWKVVAMVGEDGELSVTAYLLSQAALLKKIKEEEFAFGAYRTFQVPVTKVEQMTGLNFGKLRNFDPLRGELEMEAAMEDFRELDWYDKIRLRRGGASGAEAG